MAIWACAQQWTVTMRPHFWPSALTMPRSAWRRWYRRAMPCWNRKNHCSPMRPTSCVRPWRACAWVWSCCRAVASVTRCGRSWSAISASSTSSLAKFCWPAGSTPSRPTWARLNWWIWCRCVPKNARIPVPVWTARSRTCGSWACPNCYAAPCAICSKTRCAMAGQRTGTRFPRAWCSSCGQPRWKLLRWCALQ